MRLTFLLHPVTDLDEAADFHRRVLGLDEAWRDGDDTIAFQLPDRPVQVMVSTTDQPPGPMYLVDELSAWIDGHPEVAVSHAPAGIPGGTYAGFTAPGGSTFYVFDMAGGA